MLIRILFFTLLFAIAGRGKNALYASIPTFQESVNPQLSGNDFSTKNGPSNHGLLKDNYYLNQEEDNAVGPRLSILKGVFPNPAVLFVFNYLFKAPAVVVQNNLREARISACYTNPRYILHHNLRIPS